MGLSGGILYIFYGTEFYGYWSDTSTLEQTMAANRRAGFEQAPNRAQWMGRGHALITTNVWTATNRSIHVLATPIVPASRKYRDCPIVARILHRATMA